MSRPKKLAMESIASLLSTHMAEGGDLAKAMDVLPQHERAAYHAACWGLIQNIAGRAQRLPDTPFPEPKSVKEAMREAIASKKAAEKLGKPAEKPNENG